ncbi:MAG: hypothetical protein COT89_02180 [Candidatus Colwellbacteria bacterium CG10_big_fil_rev_8_21_14_0_10_42_22]|uniref:Uncharacterized protein n=1 Tax=Candidatus Colwellbacteria bacterium CG10_big_fil_rev_8_21_14_0_10_42_22 TaxID=1974540 RepID=A0A2H0VFJ3_9BACT|nr:MAG: hypothetical protein COT89_02180 [Candidatus Colwellbacteria bacterium CG10_big_fil_rev_8_21_14_0_10_42_22]
MTPVAVAKGVIRQRKGSGVIEEQGKECHHREDGRDDPGQHAQNVECPPRPSIPTPFFRCIGSEAGG